MPTVYWSLNNDDRLYIEGETPEYLAYDYDHRNLANWYMNSRDVITADIIPVAIDWQQPYPVGKWYMDDENQLTASGIPAPLSWSKPYPATMWYFDDELDHLFNSMIPLEITIPPGVVGAFQNCRNLHFVKIPRSVTKIGQSSFEGTALTKVCISRNCVYSPSSFPDGCEVIYYEDLYSINYNEYVEGPNAFRSTEIIPFDESSEEQPEIP